MGFGLGLGLGLGLRLGLGAGEQAEHLVGVACGDVDRVAELLLGAQRVEERLVHDVLEQRHARVELGLVGPELPVRLLGFA